MIEIFYLQNSKDRNYYSESLFSVSKQSPYNVVGFYKLFSSGLENLICIKGIINNEIILLPGYINEIPGFELFKDFVSPYGYSGPIYRSNLNKRYLETFWKEVNEWFKANNITSSFIRFSLNGNYAGFPGTIKITMYNIKGVILQNEEEQWKCYDRKVRKNVNKAQREGLKVDIVYGGEITQTQLEDFYNIYISTMERTNAADSFFYKIEAFQKFSSANGNICAFAFAKENDKTTSTEMILLSDDSAYSFLGGTLSDYFSNRPNDLLKHELINWLRGKGYNYFVLGGGYGKDDGIFRYKKSFFPDDVVEYYTGRWTILPLIYDDILNLARKRYMVKVDQSLALEEKDFFPEYRKYL